MILCDIGNTTFHFLINDKHKKYFLNEKLPKLVDKIYFISVNEKASKKFLKNFPNAINLEKKIEFNTKYMGMGIDRKMACMFQKDSIIVDAGSAITVDILKNNKHKGGFIMPGVKSYTEIYPRISEKLKFNFEKKIKLDKIPLCTNDAIIYAIYKSIILPIKEVSKSKKIIFTGGDGKILKKYFTNCVYKKELIFDNMKRIVNVNNCTSKR